ncbi:MAG: hypothetical protein JNK05_16890 [Myxococcales bacterium]|nr:hypothetical protein [Myxococcales bacterium]
MDTEERWRTMSTEGEPAPRSNFCSVWTGTHWFVWGGILALRQGTFVLANDGALYDPATDAWTPVSATNAPSARYLARATWTGTHVLLWGGRGPTHDANPTDGALYDPVRDAWTPLGTADPPAHRMYQSADWVDGKWYWLCGTRHNARVNDGACFDSATRAWSALSWPDAPAPRWEHATAWTGEEILAFGGFGPGTSYANDAVAFNPRTNAWRVLESKGAPSRRTHHPVAWTGSELCVWGGISSVGSKDLTKGALYDPRANVWRNIPTKNEPSARANHTLLWTGREVLVWGGDVRHNPQGRIAGPGGLFDPVKKSWRPLPAGEPAARVDHGAVWTGEELLLWGGSAEGSGFVTRYFAEGHRVRL